MTRGQRRRAEARERQARAVELIAEGPQGIYLEDRVEERRSEFDALYRWALRSWFERHGEYPSGERRWQRVASRLGLRLRPAEVGYRWSYYWLARVGLRRVAEGFGVGCHSDRLLTMWACEREQEAKRAARALLHELHLVDRGRAADLARRWPGVFG